MKDKKKHDFLLFSSFTTFIKMPKTSSPSTTTTTRPFIFQQLYQLFTILYKYFQSTLFIKTQTPVTKASTTVHNSINLQYYKGKTLVLDLDETLVHSVRLGTTESTVNASIKKKTIEVTSDKQSILYEVYKRPHVDFFLSTVCIVYLIIPTSTKLCTQISQWYKVVIFTASMSEYADPVIDWLDQDQTLISQRYFRQVKTGCDIIQTIHFVFT